MLTFTHYAHLSTYLFPGDPDGRIIMHNQHLCIKVGGWWDGRACTVVRGEISRALIAIGFFVGLMYRNGKKHTTQIEL